MSIAEMLGTNPNVLNILVIPDNWNGRDKLTLGLVFLQAMPGYEGNIVVPKPGTHVQVLRDSHTGYVYFIGIIN
jgi:hypothetical protein